MTNPTTPAKVFLSYSQEDEAFRKKLEQHLAILIRQGIISTWHDRKLVPGQEWAGEISENLESANIILLLVSSAFMASDYCYDIELKRALERHKDGDAIVIPVILRPVDWEGASFGMLQGLPQNGKPVAKWADQDEAFEDIVRGIRKVLEK